MEKFCSKLLGIMKLEIVNYMIIIVLCIVAIVVCVFLRDDKKYKMLLWICSVCLIVIIALFANSIVPIYKDYSSKTFVKLEDVTVVFTTLNGFDLFGTTQISVCTTEGKVVRLMTTEQLPNGEYKANIVYAKRSKYLVDWKIIEQ